MSSMFDTTSVVRFSLSGAHIYVFFNLRDFWLIFFSLPDCDIIGEKKKRGKDIYIMLSKLKKRVCNNSSSFFLLFHGFLTCRGLMLCRGGGTMKMSLQWGSFVGEVLVRTAL